MSKSSLHEHFSCVQDVFEPSGIGIGLGERIWEITQAFNPVKSDVLFGFDTADCGNSGRYPPVPDGVVWDDSLIERLGVSVDGCWELCWKELLEDVS